MSDIVPAVTENLVSKFIDEAADTAVGEGVRSLIEELPPSAIEALSKVNAATWLPAVSTIINTLLPNKNWADEVKAGVSEVSSSLRHRLEDAEKNKETPLKLSDLVALNNAMLHERFKNKLPKLITSIDTMFTTAAASANPAEYEKRLVLVLSKLTPEAALQILNQDGPTQTSWLKAQIGTVEADKSFGDNVSDLLDAINETADAFGYDPLKRVYLLNDLEARHTARITGPQPPKRSLWQTIKARI